MDKRAPSRRTPAPSGGGPNLDSPASTRPPAATASALFDPRSALAGPIRSPRASIPYMMALGVVASAMVLLPLVYLAIVAGVGYALYLHATENFAMFDQATPRMARTRLVAYVGPLFAGAVLIVFMIKPIFARRRRRDVGVVIDENNEPLLHGFVHRLCELMGAPKPKVIRVDCDVNASASYRRGLWSMLTGDLVLTVGLPLAAGMTLRQLAGILAHEFGHFTQRAGMRLSYVIRSVDVWFARVVYERDAWDEKLAQMAQIHDWLALLVLVARAGVWLTRRVLWCLMGVARLIGCLVSRQMEFDADRCEVLVAGSRHFEGTFDRLQVLALAQHAALSRLQASWRDRRLGDNLPAMIAHAADRIPAEVSAKLREATRQRRSGWLDTHPCDADRIRAATAAEAEGIILSDGPASALFRHFEAACKAATLIHYREYIDRTIRQENLVPAKEWISEQAQAGAEAHAESDFFGHPLTPARPLFMPESRLPELVDPPAAVRAWAKARRQVQRNIEKIRGAIKVMDETEASLYRLEQAEALLGVGIKAKPAEFGLDRWNLDEVLTRQKEAGQKRQRAQEVLNAYDAVWRLRMTCALQLLGDGEVVGRLPEAKALSDEAARLVRVSAQLGESYTGYERLRRSHAGLAAAVSRIQGNRNIERLESLARARISDALQFVRVARDCVQGLDYPFPHASGRISIAQFLLTHVPSDHDPGRAMDAWMKFMENFEALHGRVTGRLAYIADRVEKTLDEIALSRAAGPR